MSRKHESARQVGVTTGTPTQRRRLNCWGSPTHPNLLAASAGKFAAIDITPAEHQAYKNIVFNYSVGVRLIDEQPQPMEIQQTEGEQDFVYFELTALFSAHYRLDGKVDEQALEEFARVNVGYHVWPYWREYVQNTCARVGLPIIPIPIYQLSE